MLWYHKSFKAIWFILTFFYMRKHMFYERPYINYVLTWEILLHWYDSVV